MRPRSTRTRPASTGRSRGRRCTTTSAACRRFPAPGSRSRARRRAGARQGAAHDQGRGRRRARHRARRSAHRSPAATAPCASSSCSAPAGRPMKAEEFLRGTPVAAGTRVRMTAAARAADHRAPSSRPAMRRRCARSWQAAFGGPAEADLVDRLRATGDLVLALVAEHGRPWHRRLCRRFRGWRSMLGEPVSVPAVRACAARASLPDRTASRHRQRAGPRAGLRSARRSAASRLVFVLGDPAYYSRFGFDAAAAAAVHVSPIAGPHFHGAAARARRAPLDGTVRYPPAFAELG